MSEPSSTMADAQPTTAAHVCRGLTRWFHQQRHVVLSEVALPNGRRADLVTLCPRGMITIVEVKVARADLLGDGKWQDYLDWCDRFYWAISPELDPALLDDADHLPDRCGLLVADRYQATMVRGAADHPLASARRRSEWLRHARTAAIRLMQLGDPELALSPDGHAPGF